jgi:O-antigen ligase
MTERSDLWVFRLSLASVSAVLVSIAAAQILLGLSLITWMIWGPRRINWPGYLFPLVAFMLTTLLSLAASPDPGMGLKPVQKFFLFSMGLLAATFLTNERRILMTINAMLIVATVASVAAMVQFGFQYVEFLSSGDLADDPTILARITGFMGHWMTFSGEQMLVWCAAVPLAVTIGQRKYLIPLAVIGIALLLSFTRGVWLGSAAGIAVAALYLPPRQIVRLLIPIGIVAVLASGLILRRVSMSFLEGGFSPDSSRLEMLDVGLRMIGDHPLFGVGPERIRTEFPEYYRGNNLENFFYGHLHNNYLQLAAERGLLCLGAFLWLLAKLGLDLKRRARSTDPSVKWMAVSGLSVLVAFSVAGLTEYNFGDSEVLMLFMFLVSMSYGLSAKEEAGHLQNQE